MLTRLAGAALLSLAFALLTCAAARGPSLFSALIVIVGPVLAAIGAFLVTQSHRNHEETPE